MVERASTMTSVLPRRVVVTGLPGSGKSTLGRTLADRIGFAVCDKDDYLEMLFESTEEAAGTRSVLSRRADDDFTSAAELLPEVVLISFWRRPELSLTSGTPTEWLSESAAVVEVFCECSVGVAVRRFRSRQRHERHGDAQRDPADLTAQFGALAALGPLGVGRLVRVDTETPIDIDGVLAAVRDALTDTGCADS